MTSKYFLSICNLSFHFLNGAFWSAEVFNIDKVQFSDFFSFKYHAFGVNCFYMISKQDILYKYNI